MPNKYLPEDGLRAARVRDLFSRLAERYDLVNDLMSLGLHRRWKRETVLLGLAGARRPARVLDLCCGSGDLCFLAEDLGAARVAGADFTLPMLAVARRRKRSRASAAAFVQADALSLPFPEGAFDVLTVGYGLRNLADLSAALQEMYRVLAPGGRLVVLDFGKPDNPAVRTLYGAYFRLAMPVIGRIFHGDPDTYRYIPESLERYPAQRGVQRLMRDAGFERARYENRMLGTMGIHVGEKSAADGRSTAGSDSR